VSKIEHYQWFRYFQWNRSNNNHSLCIPLRITCSHLKWRNTGFRLENTIESQVILVVTVEVSRTQHIQHVSTNLSYRIASPCFCAWAASAKSWLICCRSHTRFLNVFGRKIRRKSALRSCILFASTEVMHRPRSDSFLHFYIRTQKANSYGKINCYRSAFAYRSHARALAAGLPRQDHVWITTNNLFHFHNNEFDEIPCRLDSTEYARSFRKHPTLPWQCGDFWKNSSALFIAQCPTLVLIWWLFKLTWHVNFDLSSSTCAQTQVHRAL